jgi:hypothetical protein
MPKVQGAQTRTGYMEPIVGSYEQITGLGTAKGLTAPPAGATMAMIQPETQSIRWRDDGTNPTASVGMIVAAGDILFYTGNFSDLKFIQVSASAIINVTYYR